MREDGSWKSQNSNFGSSQVARHTAADAPAAAPAEIMGDGTRERCVSRRGCAALWLSGPLDCSPAPMNRIVQWVVWGGAPLAMLHRKLGGI